MVKMRSNIDGSVQDVDEETARQWQAAGKAHSVEDAEQKARAGAQGSYDAVTGRVDTGMAEKPEPVNAAGTPDQHNDEPPEPEDDPAPSRSTGKKAR
jgi:hypothetical protein